MVKGAIIPDECEAIDDVLSALAKNSDFTDALSARRNEIFGHTQALREAKFNERASLQAGTDYRALSLLSKSIPLRATADHENMLHAWGYAIRQNDFRERGTADYVLKLAQQVDPNNLRGYAEGMKDRINNLLYEAREEKYHPVEAAALFSLGLPVIKPFETGNGRVGQLLREVSLAQAGLPGFMLTATTRPTYITVLEKAQHGMSVQPEGQVRIVSARVKPYFQMIAQNIGDALVSMVR